MPDAPVRETTVFLKPPERLAEFDAYRKMVRRGFFSQLDFAIGFSYHDLRNASIWYDPNFGI